MHFSGKLRPETKQTDAYDAGLRAFAETGGGVLSLPPGYGKTCMALAFSAHLKVRTMIVVHKEFLANQWRDRIQAFCPGATIGRVQGDEFDIEKDFVIAMIQTMCQREFPKDAFDTIGLLIVDEAHHIGAPAFSQFMFKICPRFTLGLTATPERKDGLTRLLYWFLGPEFYRVERTDQKTTRVQVLHYIDEAFQEAPPVSRFGKINMAGMINIVTELGARNDLIVETINKALLASRKVLVLTDRREHCFVIHERLGSKSGLYIGGMKESDLSISAEKSVVIATFQLAQEGLDIPTLDTVILATPKSDIKQSIGRIMRETPGKVNAPLIIDVVDHWSVFFSMFRKRKVVYLAGGFEIEDATAEPAPQTEVFGKGQCLL
jgi:superfamily II DNA or RNA helicase